jgi:hypothetical protein
VQDIRVLLNEAQTEMLDLCIKIPHSKQKTLAENVVDNSWSKFPFQEKEKICGVITEKLDGLHGFGLVLIRSS